MSLPPRSPRDRDMTPARGDAFVLVLMPFDPHFNRLYNGIKAAIEGAGARCKRVDEQTFTGPIMEHVYRQIEKADIVVAELTRRNVNVYYEVGFAHALEKTTILLTRDTRSTPFHLKSYNLIAYSNISQLKPRLQASLKKFMRTPGPPFASTYFEGVLENALRIVPPDMALLAVADYPNYPWKHGFQVKKLSAAWSYKNDEWDDRAKTLERQGLLKRNDSNEVERTSVGTAVVFLALQHSTFQEVRTAMKSDKKMLRKWGIADRDETSRTCADRESQQRDLLTPSRARPAAGGAAVPETQAVGGSSRGRSGSAARVLAGQPRFEFQAGIPESARILRSDLQTGTSCPHGGTEPGTWEAGSRNCTQSSEDRVKCIPKTVHDERSVWRISSRSAPAGSMCRRRHRIRLTPSLDRACSVGFERSLRSTTIDSTEPATEDWGWDMDVEGGGASYMVGASGDAQGSGPNVDWVVQVHRHRSFKDKLLGRGKMTVDDPLVTILQKIVRADNSLEQVSVDRNA